MREPEDPLDTISNDHPAVKWLESRLQHVYAKYLDAGIYTDPTEFQALWTDPNFGAESGMTEVEYRLATDFQAIRQQFAASVQAEPPQGLPKASMPPKTQAFVGMGTSKGEKGLATGVGVAVPQESSTAGLRAVMGSGPMGVVEAPPRQGTGGPRLVDVQASPGTFPRGGSRSPGEDPQSAPASMRPEAQTPPTPPQEAPETFDDAVGAMYQQLFAACWQSSPQVLGLNPAMDVDIEHVRVAFEASPQLQEDVAEVLRRLIIPLMVNFGITEVSYVPLLSNVDANHNVVRSLANSDAAQKAWFIQRSSLQNFTP